MSGITRLVAIFGLVLAAAMAPAIAHADAVARVESGRLLGEERDGIHSFKGVPFAAPPVGDLRWRAPQSPIAWSETRDARSYGPACPQPDRTDGGGGGRAAVQNEDCLTLNIWAPKDARNLPVMVWIHGGGHRIGSGTYPIYDGAALARQGVVLVTINYRLGLLGYFAHPALTAEASASEPLGNYGFMDQLAALQWVKRNISAFGGNARDVTVFGESAGGASIVYLLTNPRARGLFHRAIVQSGGGLQRPETLAQQEHRGVERAASIGLTANATARDLRRAPASRWLEAMGPLQGAGFGEFIDGRVITEAPWRAFAEDRAIDVPLMIGANDNEASVLTTLGVPSAALSLVAGLHEAELRALYGDVPNEEYARQAMGDAFFVAPAAWVAEKTARGAPTFVYHFTYVASRRRGATPGAGHGSEIPYIFQTWDRLPVPPGFLTDEDRAFSAMISSCWTSFAIAGAPRCEGGPQWPAYTRADDRVMLFASASRAEPQPRRAQLDLLIAGFLGNAPP